MFYYLERRKYGVIGGITLTPLGILEALAHTTSFAGSTENLNSPTPDILWEG